MPLKWTRTEEPEEEPVSLADAKAHAKVDVDDDDALIAVYIQAAREIVENYTGRALITQTWAIYLDRFPMDCDPDGEAIVLPWPPLAAVVAIQSISPSGTVLVGMDPADYTADVHAQPGRVVPAYGLSWPDTKAVPNAVEVQFTAGYGAAADVPAALRLAILELVTDMYDNRSPVPTSFARQQMEHLCGPFVLGRIWE